MFVRFFRFLTGIQPRSMMVHGRPVPPGVRKATPLVVRHDRRLSAGFFVEGPRKKGKDKAYRLVVWKSYQNKVGKWIVSTSFFPDEIDPALRLLEECRRNMPTS